MSAYDRWRTAGPDDDEDERLLEEADCSICGESLDDDQLEQLNRLIADCDTDEDETNVTNSAMCAKCEAIDNGDEPETESP